MLPYSCDTLPIHHQIDISFEQESCSRKLLPVARYWPQVCVFWQILDFFLSWWSSQTSGLVCMSALLRGYRTITMCLALKRVEVNEPCDQIIGTSSFTTQAMYQCADEISISSDLIAATWSVLCLEAAKDAPTWKELKSNIILNLTSLMCEFTNIDNILFICGLMSLAPKIGNSKRHTYLKLCGHWSYLYLDGLDVRIDYCIKHSERL